jgi:hypothetical protein
VIPGGGPERTPVPAQDGPLLQVGGILGPAARLLPDLGGVRIGGSPMMRLGPVAVIRLVRAVPKLIHAHQYHRFVA